MAWRSGTWLQAATLEGGDIRKRAWSHKALVVKFRRIHRPWPASEVKYRGKEKAIVTSSGGKVGRCRGISRWLIGSTLGSGNSTKEKHIPLR